MKVLNHNNTTHTLKIIPRYLDVANAHAILFKNEDTRIESSITPTTKTIIGGYISYVFDLTVKENEAYSYKITDSTEDRIVHRGKVFTTDQETQNYSVNG